MNIHEILEKYWGYKTFRPLQEDIISSVMAGKDTLALLPTGGGKSLCYQVPALVNEGLCLVISPLISLMKDQAESLAQKGIKVLSIYSGLTAREVDIAMDNAVYGDYKFLFLSPERLESELFLARAVNMPVSLIAVDEAHCISQWGYDFRPSYLKIADIKRFFPAVPILALTATATPEVKKDIQEKLLFQKDSAFFEMSFDRKNLIYAVLHEEDKRGRILKLLEKVPGCAIIYVSNRKATADIAQFLQRNKIKADYYHGGLFPLERSAKQESWKKGETRVMVATNAFGMGIDKADVRLVIHNDLPDSPEAYYQEAGRAGRDGAKSFAIALANESDKIVMEEKTDRSFPTVEEIKTTYHALGNFFQLPIGSGLNESFDFIIGDFSQRYGLGNIKVYNALQFLERAGYISNSEGVFIPSRFMVLLDNLDLYKFEIENKKYEALIKILLRSYGGCFETYVKLDERLIATRLNITAKQVSDQLKELKRLNIMDYQPQKNLPQITFIHERVDRNNLLLDYSFLSSRRRITEEKIKSILDYAFSEGKCRSKILLGYFGEKLENNCGHCDYCLKYTGGSKEGIRSKIQAEIMSCLSIEPLEINILLDKINSNDKSEALAVIRRMIDSRIIVLKEGKYALSNVNSIHTNQ